MSSGDGRTIPLLQQHIHHQEVCRCHGGDKTAGGVDVKDIQLSNSKIVGSSVVRNAFDSRLQTFFDMVDRDADGRITEAEVREISKVSASAKKQAAEYAKFIMEELDTDKLGYIMIDNLETVFLRTLPQTARGEGQNSSQVRGQQIQTTHNSNPLRRWYKDFKYFLQDNWQRAWVLVFWISVLAGLLTWKHLQYENKEDVYEVMGHCVCMAKGAAET